MPLRSDANLNANNQPELSFRARAGAAPGYQSLIDELEASAINRDIAKRVDIMQRLTDLFVAGSDGFGAEQVALFDEVMCRLLDKIESAARAAFGQRIADIAKAPPEVCRMLALDDSIEVARPLLSASQQLSDETLIAGAKTQGHMLAISQRRLLSENVTDVLVERGDRQVVVSTAANSGAHFSEYGYSTLVLRSDGDRELALRVWSRPEIPREHLIALFAVASNSVRLEFEAADRKKASLVHEMIKRASDQIQTEVRQRSPGYAAAEAQVRLLNQAGALNEHRLRKFSEAGKFDETTIALALLSNLPIGVIERVLTHGSSDQMLVLTKSAGFSWTTTKAILLMRAMIRGTPADDIDQCLGSFNRLTQETARTAIQYYRLRERAASNKTT